MYVLQYIQGILATRKKIPLANTSEISLLPGNGPHLSIELNQTKTLEIMSQIKENIRNTPKIWRDPPHAKDSIRCTSKYDQNLKNNIKTSNNLDVWKIIFIR